MTMNPLKKIVDNLWEDLGKTRKVTKLEMVEFNEIADKLMDRIDIKIKTLKEIELRINQKIAVLDGLMTRYKTMNLPGELPAGIVKAYPNDIRTLADKGFGSDQIARILDMPSGEVELMLNLVH